MNGVVPSLNNATSAARHFVPRVVGYKKRPMHNMNSGVRGKPTDPGRQINMLLLS